MWEKNSIMLQLFLKTLKIKWINQKNLGLESPSFERDVTLCTPFTHLCTTSPRSLDTTWFPPSADSQHTHNTLCSWTAFLCICSLHTHTHFNMHKINSHERAVHSMCVMQPHAGRQKRSRRERGSERKQTLDTRFCHAGAVCRSARAQRLELKLRNTDRLSQLLLLLLPPYTVFFKSISPFVYLQYLPSHLQPSPRFSDTYSIPALLSSSSPSAQTPASSEPLCLQTDLCPVLLQAFLFMTWYMSSTNTQAAA